MEKNIIFCFTGTGNSLKASKDIAASLENCDVLPMGKASDAIGVSEYKRIGFVFPVYFLGLPLRVREFIDGLRVQPNCTGYFFAIGTYGNIYGNAVGQANALLRRKGKKLSYAANLNMRDNAITFYDRKQDLDKLTASYRRDMTDLIAAIGACRTKRIGRSFWLADVYHRALIAGVPNRDAGYQVSDACTQCGVCAKVCPVRNIKMDGKPNFFHHCEQCMACIQLCPSKAIDYKGKCENRVRYKNPDTGLGELIAFQKAPLLTNEPV